MQKRILYVRIAKVQHGRLRANNNTIKRLDEAKMNDPHMVKEIHLVLDGFDYMDIDGTVASGQTHAAPINYEEQDEIFYDLVTAFWMNLSHWTSLHTIRFMARVISNRYERLTHKMAITSFWFPLYRLMYAQSDAHSIYDMLTLSYRDLPNNKTSVQISSAHRVRHKNLCITHEFHTCVDRARLEENYLGPHHDCGLLRQEQAFQPFEDRSCSLPPRRTILNLEDFTCSPNFFTPHVERFANISEVRLVRVRLEEYSQWNQWAEILRGCFRNVDCFWMVDCSYVAAEANCIGALHSAGFSDIRAWVRSAFDLRRSLADVALLSFTIDDWCAIAVLLERVGNNRTRKQLGEFDYWTLYDQYVRTRRLAWQRDPEDMGWYV